MDAIGAGTIFRLGAKISEKEDNKIQNITLYLKKNL